ALLNKNVSSEELKNTIYTVNDTGFCYNNIIGRKLIKTLYQNATSGQEIGNFYLSPKELRFLQLAATDFTYERIADEMHLTVHGVDKIRDHLFLKFDVKNRAALAVKSVLGGVVV
ncbi:MAG TPA: LuxR C-terminal-related transcriptional regulator, partial [Chitinophagaceae bacterium]|nr:LuxR C-terminal-related transcriptional regulator [Chitinophagaceae bacterium]